MLVFSRRDSNCLRYVPRCFACDVYVILLGFVTRLARIRLCNAKAARIVNKGSWVRSRASPTRLSIVNETEVPSPYDLS